MPSFSLAQISGPPKVPRMREPNTLSRTVKACATLFTSFIWAPMMSWFTKKAPKALIIGMHLTRDEVQILIQACQELEGSMTRQKEEMEALQKIKGSDHARRAMKTILGRHRRIYDRLDNLTIRLRNNHSEGSFRLELEELARIMARQRLLWDEHSARLELSWKVVSERYWPLIADSYAILFEILSSFKQTLNSSWLNDALWSNEAMKRNRCICHKSLKSALKGSSLSKPKSKDKHVVFEETYHSRMFSQKDAPKEVSEAHANAEWHGYGRGTDFEGKLASDGKHSAKHHQTRVHKKKTDMRIAVPHRGSIRSAEISDREKRQEAQRREMQPVFERSKVETGRRMTGTRMFFDNLQETRMFVPL
ncbi:hypothetical protein AA0112_g6855 [Alternaria arborescens]|nr:hypothetical protein AA0112_g6855 [Alternaria arborescens]